MASAKAMARASESGPTKQRVAPPLWWHTQCIHRRHTYGMAAIEGILSTLSQAHCAEARRSLFDLATAASAGVPALQPKVADVAPSQDSKTGDSAAATPSSSHTGFECLASQQRACDISRYGWPHSSATAGIRGLTLLLDTSKTRAPRRRRREHGSASPALGLKISHGVLLTMLPDT